MEYFYRLLGLHNIENQRIIQIGKQRQLDNKVADHIKTCPNLIAQYYLLQREISRQQQTTFMKVSLTSKLETLKKEVNYNEVLYSQLEDALGTTFEKSHEPDYQFCTKLSKIVSSPLIVSVSTQIVECNKKISE